MCSGQNLPVWRVGRVSRPFRLSDFGVCYLSPNKIFSSPLTFFPNKVKNHTTLPTKHFLGIIKKAGNFVLRIKLAAETNEKYEAPEELATNYHDMGEVLAMNYHKFAEDAIGRGSPFPGLPPVGGGFSMFAIG